MVNRYYIKHKTSDMYVHFNPHTDQYFIGDKLLGAAIFLEPKGSNFMREAGLSMQEWDLIPINAQSIITGPRSEEFRVFDATH